MPVPTSLKLAMLWVSVTLCYLSGDYFGLYVPGKPQQLLGVIEMALTLWTVWTAWTWPRSTA